jgi:hypothetical protein
VDQEDGAGGVVREVAREGAVEQALAGPADGRGHEQVGPTSAAHSQTAFGGNRWSRTTGYS